MSAELPSIGQLIAAGLNPTAAAQVLKAEQAKAAAGLHPYRVIQQKAGKPVDVRLVAPPAATQAQEKKP